MTTGQPLPLENLRKMLLEVEAEIGRNVCADPVIDIILAVAVDNARGRHPTVTETVFASAASQDTARRFVDALLAREALVTSDQGGLAVHPRIQSILEGKNRTGD